MWKWLKSFSERRYHRHHNIYLYISFFPFWTKSGDEPALTGWKLKGTFRQKKNKHSLHETILKKIIYALNNRLDQKQMF